MLLGALLQGSGNAPLYSMVSRDCSAHRGTPGSPEVTAVQTRERGAFRPPGLIGSSDRTLRHRISRRHCSRRVGNDKCLFRWHSRRIRPLHTPCRERNGRSYAVGKSWPRESDSSVRTCFLPSSCQRSHCMFHSHCRDSSPIRLRVRKSRFVCAPRGSFTKIPTSPDVSTGVTGVTGVTAPRTRKRGAFRPPSPYRFSIFRRMSPL